MQIYHKTYYICPPSIEDETIKDIFGSILSATVRMVFF